MKVKELRKTVNLAWSPKSQNSIYLAAGTAAQQLDAKFNTSAVLELYNINLADPSLDMSLCCSVPSEYRFHKLVWGSYGFGDSSDKGVIIGGCDSGRIMIYNAAKLLKNEEGLLACPRGHTKPGPVRSIDFNSFQKNLLATGTSESETLIWDLNKLDSPMIPGTPTQPLSDIVSVSWNKQVQSILVALYSTRCVIWDLRENKTIFELTDSSNKVRWKTVAWNPEVATQLCIASEEDSHPVIQMWDLKLSKSPIKIFEGHQKGILCTDWCNDDPDLLISCGNDNKLLVWNPNTTSPSDEIVCEMPVETYWNFEVDWCPRNPFLVASSSFDGRATVYSLFDGKSPVQPSNTIADSFPGINRNLQSPYSLQIQLQKPPRWMRKPVGVSFAFGGKLVSFNSNDKSVYISQVVTEPQVILKFKELEDVLQQGNLYAYCCNKAENVSQLQYKDVWNFIATQFYGEAFKNQACSLLGISQTTLKEKMAALNIEDDNVNSNDNSTSDTFSNMSRIGPADNDDAFANLADQNSTSPESSEYEPPKKPLKITHLSDTEGLLCDALLSGNIELSIDMCIRENRMADALILSISGGHELFAQTQARYFEKSDNYITNLISSVVSKEWNHAVENCDLSVWEHILVAVLTYTKDEECRTLCKLLGERLLLSDETEFSKRAALICFICAGDVNQVIENWSCNSKYTSEVIEELAELGIVMKEAMKYRSINLPMTGSLAKVLTQYAELLASQGYLTAAYTYLNDSSEEGLEMMLDRLMCALKLKQPYPIRAEVHPVKQDNYSCSQSLPYNSSYQQYMNSVPPKPYNNTFNQVSQQSANMKQEHFTTKSIFPPSSISMQNNSFEINQKQAQPSMFSYSKSQYSDTDSLLSQSGLKPLGPSFATPANPLVNSQMIQKPPTASMNFQQFKTPLGGTVTPPPPLPSSSSTVSSVMGQAASTPPPPPSTSKVPYSTNNTMQTTGQRTNQGIRKYVLDPSVQGGQRFSTMGGFPQHAAPDMTQINQHASAIMPTISQMDQLAPTVTSPVQSINQQPPITMSAINQISHFPTSQPEKHKPPYSAMPTMNQFNQPTSVTMASGFNQMPQQPPTIPLQSYSSMQNTNLLHSSTRNTNSSYPSTQKENSSFYQIQNTNLSSQANLNTLPNSTMITQQSHPVMKNEFPNPPMTIPSSMSSTVASGWNDPPSMRFEKPVLQNETNYVSQKPITQPLFNSAPDNSSAPPSALPNVQYNQSRYHPTMPNSYQNNVNQNSLPPMSTINSVKPKAPLPEQHACIKTILDELRNQCFIKTNNPQMKRKLEDVGRKLEMLYDAIRESKLSQHTFTGLHDIVKSIQEGNYQACLAFHTQLVSGPDFSVIASFMPGIKVLIQSALQLDVYLQ